ncbi:hypothetical protein MP638_001339 [Amoeboaphelidium occidentale]|nr:hypothetical protein MP638_001339 [Amoeboaphelidium occidentale]
MTKFRPCIDLHEGKVKQIVGGTLKETTESVDGPVTNFSSSLPPEHYAELYRKHDLTGGHVIMLGNGYEKAAKRCLSAWPNVFQVGGGITEDNAKEWLQHGAGKIIVTSYLFPEGKFSIERLKNISDIAGKDRLVVDLSFRKVVNGSNFEYVVAMNKWQTLTDMKITHESIKLFEEYSSELLVHAADVEGLCKGIDQDINPVTYAGGGNSINDLELVRELSNGKVDLTFGSALDVFGGSTVKLADCIQWNQQHG